MIKPINPKGSLWPSNEVSLWRSYKRTTIIKLIQKHLEETNSPQKPLLETYSYPDLKKVLSLYNIQPITDDKNENKNI
ncbi:MAG: hypothetical protein RLZZ354_524 [Pseudomonadota bacterium]|jgi:hypothetical protein